jgi:excisionase family DNA binding protein
VTEPLVQFTLPPELVEVIAQRAADILAERQAAAVDDKRWFTTPEATRYTGLARQFLFDARSSGRLPRHRAGRKAMFDRRDLDELIRADR